MWSMTTRAHKPRPRPAFGERLAAARVRAGLTQAEVGARIGLSQRAIASWERQENASPNPEQLVRLAEMLEVGVDELLCGSAEQIRKKPGPKGKLYRLFDEVSGLPRSHQTDIIEIVEMLVKGKRKQMATAKH